MVQYGLGLDAEIWEYNLVVPPVTALGGIGPAVEILLAAFENHPFDERLRFEVAEALGWAGSARPPGRADAGGRLGGPVPPGGADRRRPDWLEST